MRHSTTSYAVDPISSYVKINGIFKVGINVEFSSECSCTKTDTKPDNPDRDCNNRGYKVCGKCVNVPEWNNQTLDVINSVECNNDQDCGDYGKCICGKCQCQNVFMNITKSPERFYGRGCTCTDLICPFTKKGQCMCECGKCKCNTGFKGIDCSEIECDYLHIMKKCKETEGAPDCSGRGDCVCGTCTCPYNYTGTHCETLTVPTVRCSDIKECMVKVFESNEHAGCNITVTLVQKLVESTSFFVHTCQMVHHKCVRSFMIEINQNGKNIDHIRLKSLDSRRDCANDQNPYFRKRLLYFCGITTAGALAFYSITILLHIIYIKWFNDNQRRVRGMVIKDTERYEITAEPVDETLSS
ncbi:Integrin beta-4 [Thelohanellus kitauei]|uniref:Integrin beta-4 n=1 Tax=Thelohanellus kitauei TaxID=669202 RepID=A0A0C2M9Y3_THEKT|nr:Integrin beta-4 [Thelohanellus kitauei]